jgi:hypothetical protein
MRLCTFSSSIIVSSSLLAVAGCSGSNALATGGATGTAGSSSSSSSTTTTTTSGTGGGTSKFDAGGAITTYTTGIGPISLAPGAEETNCITIHLGNAAGGYARRFRADLGVGSHHMIVYQSNDATESPTPAPCQALAGILMGEHPVFIAQQATATMNFPSDENGVPVGFQIMANQMVKIELHAINTTQAPLMVTGKAYVDTIPLESTITLSDLAFWGTTQFSIPPLAMTSTKVLYQAAVPGTYSFAITTHQHHLGTEMQVWYGTGATDMSDRIADGRSWSDPPLVMLNPAIQFPSDGSKGLAYQCTWSNVTTTTVKFGESFNDEMCFLWHYYYPTQGFQYCIDGFCQNSP